MLYFQSPPPVSQKVMVNEPPPGFPLGGLLLRELPVSRTFSNISVEFLIKIFLIKRNFTLLSKAIGEERTPMFPKRGPYGNRCPFPELYLAYPSGSPVKEPSLQVPLIELPQRELLYFQSPPFVFQSPW